jgi:hypothetical protein
MGLGPSGKAMAEMVVVAPAPRSLNNTNSIEGAGGGGCPSPDKAHAPVEWVRRFFCDVHRRAKNGEGYRITFTMDGITFRHVDSFTDIPAREGDKIYIDTIPLNHTDGAIELLRRGVELYCLRRLTLVGKKREELKLPKTTRGDIRTLMGLEERWFRKLSEDFLIMRRLISAYRTMLKTHQQYLNRYRAVSEKERSGLKPVIDVLEKQMNIMAEEIAEEACRRYPAYNKLVEELGIDGKVSAMEALAELMTYIDFAKSPLRGLKKLLGLYKPVKSKKRKYWRIYDGRLHQAATRLAITYYKTSCKTTPNGRHCWQLIRQIKQLLTTNQAPG